MSGFDFDVIQRSWLYLFREGMTFTLTLTFLAMVCGIFFGKLLAMMRLSSIKPVSVLASGYVNVMRSVPLVMVLAYLVFMKRGVSSGYSLIPGTINKTFLFLVAANVGAVIMPFASGGSCTFSTKGLCGCFCCF